MTAIYGSATMTIFADGAAGDNAGMIDPRADSHESGRISNDGRYFERLVNRSLLSTRVWIFQRDLCLAGSCISLLADDVGMSKLPYCGICALFAAKWRTMA